MCSHDHLCLQEMCGDVKAGKLKLKAKSIALEVRGMHLHGGQAAQKHTG